MEINSASNEVVQLQSDDYLSNWMSLLPETRHDESLTVIAIPGSHDSFSYLVDSANPISPDKPNFIVFDKVPLFGRVVRRIISRWGRTQRLTCTQQLQSGIRYFDIRVARRKDENGYFIVHGLYGGDIVNVFMEIRNFLEVHKKEVVILDFQHFYAFTSNDHTELMMLACKMFGDLMCPFFDDLSGITLNYLWHHGYQVLAFYRAPFYNLKFWPKTLLPNPWPNTTQPYKMIEFLEQRYSKRPYDAFYITQGVLTPTTKFVTFNIFSSAKKLGNMANVALVPWVRSKEAGTKGINIVIADFIEMDNLDYVWAVLSLNLQEENDEVMSSYLLRKTDECNECRDENPPEEMVPRRRRPGVRSIKL